MSAYKKRRTPRNKKKNVRAERKTRWADEKIRSIQKIQKLRHTNGGNERKWDNLPGDPKSK